MALVACRICRVQVRGGIRWSEVGPAVPMSNVMSRVRSFSAAVCRIMASAGVVGTTVI